MCNQTLGTAPFEFLKTDNHLFAVRIVLEGNVKREMRKEDAHHNKVVDLMTQVKS